MLIGRRVEPLFLTQKKEVFVLQNSLKFFISMLNYYMQMEYFLSVPENSNKYFNPDECHRDQGKCYL